MPFATASSVSREPGSVAKTVADTSVSKRYCDEVGGSKGPPSISILVVALFGMSKKSGIPRGVKVPKYCTAWVTLVSGVNFAIEIVKVNQSVHRQATFVFFALDVYFHQMPGKPFSGPLRLGTVCESTVYAERAVNG
jgi:hypothetical protein